MAELISQPMVIQSLYGLYSEGKLSVNRRYQRKLVWTLEEKQRLIESVLKRYPIPAVLLAERENGRYEIIDGLQRLSAIMSFVETAFEDLEGRWFGIDHFTTAKDRAQAGKFESNAGELQLSSGEVGRFLDYTFSVSVMRGASEEEVDDVFGRINTYGHQLSEQERRQAGVQGSFADCVRELGCELRGDVSRDILDLSEMPEISIDLPKTKHGYEVRADQVFWVEHGILRSTELRDSMDEQCIADILACIVGGQLVPRSKEALDRIYEPGDNENSRISNALSVYGHDMVSDEIKYCIGEILRCTQEGQAQKLRNIIFSKKTTNSFAALFTTIVIAFYEVIVLEKKRISSYASIKAAISKLDTRIDTGRGSTSVTERRKNIDAVKGLIRPHFVDSDLKDVYSNHSSLDIDALIRRSEIELPNYELKQGLLSLGAERRVDQQLMTRVVRTICGIANNGPTESGTIIIGVADKDADVRRIQLLDGVAPREVGGRKVVGIRREATFLKESVEQYFARWKNEIRNSELSSPLKEQVLSLITFHDYFGLGLLVISVPPQENLSYVGSDIYIRSGDDTELAKDGVAIASVVARFVKPAP
ncbi:GmrSD restriction endonuclease domain-containing protein [Leucobacter sp. UCD-THU]|uniref:GmrSD restriction endonuclease domain-containing protein n=1 Tax=Leucobacter sp. UCD-THU TaxID=1292023 RepID=UPI0003A8F989|nr:DUF262 domain-containing protein [Leucobacter sp. UCD-THU]